MSVDARAQVMAGYSQESGSRIVDHIRHTFSHLPSPKDFVPQFHKFAERVKIPNPMGPLRTADEFAKKHPILTITSLVTATTNGVVLLSSLIDPSFASRVDLRVGYGVATAVGLIFSGGVRVIKEFAPLGMEIMDYHLSPKPKHR